MGEEKVNLDENLKGTEGISTKLIVSFTRTASLLEEVFDRFYKKFKMSKPQFSALYLIYLSGDEGMMLSSLGDEMVVSRANITSLVDRMEARGIIKRVINPNDRRSIKAVITEEGRKIIDSVLPSHKIFSEEVLDFLNENEKKRIIELLERVQKELISNYLSD